jgi:hypothetical protein
LGISYSKLVKRQEISSLLQTSVINQLFSCFLCLNDHSIEDSSLQQLGERYPILFNILDLEKSSDETMHQISIECLIGWRVIKLAHVACTLILTKLGLILLKLPNLILFLLNHGRLELVLPQFLGFCFN